MSNIDFQKVADILEESSPEIKELMFSADLGDKIGEILEKYSLEEESAFAVFDEISYVILGLKQRSTFFSSLVEIGIEKIIAQKIASETENKIFVALDKIKKDPLIENSNEKKIETLKKPEKTVEEEEVSNGVGQSFEQIILNQAKAMQPAQVPTNLPTAEAGEKKVGVTENPGNKNTIRNYTSTTDPYREPIE